MKLNLIILLSVLLGTTSIHAEEEPTSGNGAIYAHVGTIHVYRTINLGYESPTLYQFGGRHQFRLLGDIGFWHARLFNVNWGVKSSIGMVYLFGAKASKLEINGGASFHFDEGLKGQLLGYMGTLPKIFLGYRYEKPEGRFFFKAGIGWHEAVQLGCGLRF